MQHKDSTESANSLSEVINHPYRYRVLATLSTGDPANAIQLGSTTSKDGDIEPYILERRLYDEHLPQLEDAGLINWNKRAGIISRGARFGEITNFHRSDGADRQREVSDDV